jgi:hypothetical protein
MKLVSILAKKSEHITREATETEPPPDNINRENVHERLPLKPWRKLRGSV